MFTNFKKFVKFAFLQRVELGMSRAVESWETGTNFKHVSQEFSTYGAE